MALEYQDRICTVEHNLSVANQHEVGRTTLQRLADVEEYNAWIHEIIGPYAGKRVLEVGCGIGNMTGYFLGRELMTAIDICHESIYLVKEKFAKHAELLVIQGDICDERLVKKLEPLRFDTVLCVNVLEHIDDHAQALGNTNHILNDGGRLLLFVPALQSLYGTLDKSLGHYRRYDREQIRRLVTEQGYEIEKLCYVNMAGVLGWYINAKILRRHILPRKMLRLFNMLAPFLAKLESRTELPFGLSIVCIAKKSCSGTVLNKHTQATSR